MTNPLDALGTVIGDARALWPAGDDVAGMAAADLVGLNEKLGAARRLLDAAHASVAAEIARQSRPEHGGDGLARTQGFRTPVALIAATMGTTTGDAARLVSLGDATAPRRTLTGETHAAKHPHVADALAEGRIGAAAAAAIVRMLDRVAVRAGTAAVDAAERTLVAMAPGMTAEQLTKAILQIQARIDRDGAEPRDQDLRSRRPLLLREDPDGMITLTARLDPEHAAPVKTVIEGYVTARLRARQDTRADGAEPDVDAPRETVAQMQADALAVFAEHALGCDHTGIPLAGATVVVRIDLADLQDGTGHATIDGITAPVSAGTARRMAADANIVPAVLGSDSEILDWGRAKRLFTPAQKLAITNATAAA